MTNAPFGIPLQHVFDRIAEMLATMTPEDRQRAQDEVESTDKPYDPKDRTR